MSKYRYEVFDGATGEKVAEGNVEECAKQMKITVDSFHTIKSRSHHGRGKYYIESFRTDELSENLAAIWDAKFGWIREKKNAVNYPCQGCMLRSICEFSDVYCKNWEEWYRYEHGKNSKRIKHEARRAVPQK